MKIKKLLWIFIAIMLSLLLFGCPCPTDPTPTDPTPTDPTPTDPTVSGFTFSPVAGTYSDAVELEITYYDSDSTLYITTDGSTPDTSSTVYIPGTTTISIYDDATISIVAYKNGVEIESDSAAYIIEREDLLERTITGNYSNTTGSNPVFTIDETTLTSELNFDSSNIECIYDSTSNSVDIILNNLNVFSGGNNYYLQDVLVEEYVNGEWREYVEFSTSQELLTQIAISLILDCSNSLGSNFSNVLQYAKDFVDIVKTNSSGALISIVDFATDVNSQSLITDQTTIESYIDSLSQGQYTAFYDAIQRGLNTVNGSVYPSSSQIYVTSTLPTLRWSEITDSYGYNVQVNSNNSFSGTTYVDDDTLDSSTLEYTLDSELTIGNTYYWRVRKENSDTTWGSWSSVYQFTIIDAEGSAIVSFTDGTDNFSTITDSDLVTNISGTSSKSFTIGLEGMGGVDEIVLESLAVNGNYALAESVSDLQAIFETFSEAVSNVYKVDYTRNSQVISSRQIRFKFTSTLEADGSTGEGVIIDGTGGIISENFESGSFPINWIGSWTIDSDAYSGSYSLQSNSIVNSQSTSVEVSVTVANDSTIAFDRKVSSENGYDFLTFYIDGTQPNSASWSGSVSWGEVSFEIPAGTHTLTWTYSKDGSGSSGSDCAWIDDIVIE